jgi:hypothetical protein
MWYLLLTQNLDSTRFPQKLLKWPSVYSTPIEVPGAQTAKGRESVRISRKHRNGVLTPSRDIMNEFTGKNEQAFLDACETIGVEPKAMVNTQKERYLVSEFLKHPVSWLETESLYHSYTTRGEAQEVANGIDQMLSDGAPVGQSTLFPRPKHSRASSDTASGS